MKILSFICVIMVLVLNTVPCADAHEKLNINTSVSASASNDVHRNPLNDACTPFCHCSCCASSVVVKNILPLNIHFPEYRDYNISYIDGNNTHISRSIWQPPKLI